MVKTCSNCRFSVFVRFLSKNICSRHNGLVIQNPLKLAEFCELYGEKQDDDVVCPDCSYLGLVERRLCN